MAVQADQAPVVGVARRKRRRSQLGIAGSIVVVGAAAAAIYLVMAPLLALLATAFRGPSDLLPFEPGAHWTFDNLVDVYVNTPLLSSVLPNTATFVAGSVTVTFLTAFTLAWLVERTDLPWRTTLFTAILFPLLVPGVVMAFAWTLLFAPNAGWINVMLRGVLGLGSPGPINIFSMPGLILCQGIASVPFVFLLLGAAMRTMNPALEEASSASGARPLTTFLRVTLPVLRPGVLAPLILATLVALEQFEMPLIIGFPARINVFSTRIYFELNPEDELPAYGKAAAVALLFLVAAVVLLAIYNHLIKRADRFVTVTGKGYRPTRYPLGRWRAPALLFVGFYLAVGAILPAVVLVWTSFSGGSNESLNLDAYRALFADRRFWPAVGNTFLVAGLSAGLITLVGALLAWQILRLRFPGRALLDVVSFMSIGISVGDRRLRGHGAASDDPDRALRHRVDPDPCLFVSPGRLDPPVARFVDADPRRARGGVCRLGWPLAGHRAPGGAAAAGAVADGELRAAVHRRLPGVHDPDGPAVRGQLGAERHHVEAAGRPADRAGGGCRHAHPAVRHAGDLRAAPAAPLSPG